MRCICLLPRFVVIYIPFEVQVGQHTIQNGKLKIVQLCREFWLLMPVCSNYRVFDCPIAVKSGEGKRGEVSCLDQHEDYDGEILQVLAVRDLELQGEEVGKGKNQPDTDDYG